MSAADDTLTARVSQSEPRTGYPASVHQSEQPNPLDAGKSDTSTESSPPPIPTIPTIEPTPAGKEQKGGD